MKSQTFTADDTACPMNYPGFVFRELRKRGYAADALLQGTTLTEERFQDPNTRIEFATIRRFILNAIETTGDIHLGPHLAPHFEASYIGPPAYAAMNAPRLIDGLDVLGRFAHLTFPAIEFGFPAKSSGLKSGEAEITVRPRFPFEDMSYFIISGTFIVLHNLLKDMLRMPLVASRCEFTISEPDGWPKVRDGITRIPVQFRASKNRLIFSGDLLERPLPGADPINHQRLVGVCERFSAETLYVSTPVCQVVAFLEADNNLAAPLADAAASLGYSERGLRRQLERSGTSYRKVVEQVLERRARDLLANTSQPVSVIAHELGYDTASNFARSFKRWTGMTPKAFRDGQTEQRDNGQK